MNNYIFVSILLIWFATCWSCFSSSCLCVVYLAHNLPNMNASMITINVC